MRRHSAFALLFLLAAGALLTGGCERLADLGGQQTADTTRAPGVPPPGEGLVTTTSAQSVRATAQQLRSAIEESGASLVVEVNHRQNAASAGDSLRPMRLLVFGNPALGTPLMQSVRAAGIDLPQKILVWQGADDSTRITYNAPAYLRARHEVAGVGNALDRMGGTLAGLVEGAAGRAPDTTAFNADSISAGAGLAVEASDFGFEETFSRLQGAVQANPQLSIMARVDHAGNAAGTAGDSLLPTRLLMFGNPQAGTPLMQQAPTMGIDLPQKMLVYEGEENRTFVAYNRPAYLARRHQLADTTGLSRIAETLEGLAFEATSGPAEQAELQEARRDSAGVVY